MGMTVSAIQTASPVNRRAAAPDRDLPLVSVCMSAYNVERFLGAALGSVLGQTYAHLEVIVIDNGSADRTYQVARAFSEERLRVLRVEHNLGGYEAMNKVAAMASGEFVAIYHSDDVYDLRIVEKQVAFLRAHPDVGAVFTWSKKIDDQGRVVSTFPLPREFRGKTVLDYETMFRYQVRKGCPFICPTFMTRRSVLETVGYFAPETWDIVSDVDLWVRIARQFPIAVLDEALHSYRIGDHQWSARDRESRTTRDRFFDVIDYYITKDRWQGRLTTEDLAEYEFRQCDDSTSRAANLAIRGDTAAARQVLRSRPFPWRSLRAGIYRRKVRLLALRAAMIGLLAVGARVPLAAVLRRIGP